MRGTPRANEYIHWDQSPARRRWAKQLLAQYGIGLVRSTADFYRPAVLPQTPARASLVEIRQQSRGRSRRVVLESLGQQAFSF